MSEEKKTVSIEIDGAAYEVDPAASVLQVALANQVQVPYFCYHPYLSVPGNCRQCQVKVGARQEDGSVRWMPKLAVSCNTRVAPGMVVETVSEEVRQAQAANMEFLLINHPLDCPICDQVGECWLQEHAFTAGPGQTRFREEKVHFDKRVDVGPHVLLDKERCIQCTRCIRFCDEVTGTSELALFARGDKMEVGIFPGMPLENPYSGNVVDICPVGALTLKEFRFKSRLWFLKSAPSVCPGCARGCNVKVWHRDGAIARLTPRENADVNQTWICDTGRLIGGGLAAVERLREPRVGGQGGNGRSSASGARSAPAAWEAALQAAAAVLSQAEGKIAAVIRPWATLEEAYLLTGLLEHLGAGRVEVAVPVEEEGNDDDLLLRADKTPNRRGVLELLAGCTPGLVELDSLMSRAATGEVRVIVSLGHDLGTGKDASALARALDGGLQVVLLAAHESEAASRSAVALPCGFYPEVDGTVVNFQGRVQKLVGAYPPPFLARPAVQILGDLAALIGAGTAGARARDVFDDIGRSKEAFRGLSFDDLGAHGALLPGAAAKSSAEES